MLLTRQAAAAQGHGGGAGQQWGAAEQQVLNDFCIAAAEVVRCAQELFRAPVQYYIGASFQWTGCNGRDEIRVSASIPPPPPHPFPLERPQRAELTRCVAHVRRK